jgi:hypothetical protein
MKSEKNPLFFADDRLCAAQTPRSRKCPMPSRAEKAVENAT